MFKKLTFSVFLAICSANASAGEITNAINSAKTSYKVGKEQMASNINAVWDKFVAGDKSAFDILVESANKGDASAMNYIGYALALGINGLQKNERAALEYFHAGSAKSQLAAYNAGVMFYTGQGTWKSNKKAIPYFELAAKGQPFAAAHGWLAFLYNEEGDLANSEKYALSASGLFDTLGYYFAAKYLLKKDIKQAEQLASAGTEKGDSGCAKIMALISMHKSKSGSDTSKRAGLKMAASYEMISRSLKKGELTISLSNQELTELEEQEAKGYVSNWWATHKVERFDYKKLLVSIPK